MIIPKTKRNGLGRIRGGNWDHYRKHIEDTEDKLGIIIRGLYERFSEEKEWEETVYYTFLKKLYETKYRSKYQYKSFESYIQVHLKKYDNLYRDIKNNGYKKNHKGRTIRPGTQWNSHLEVLVTIDRHGQINLFDGHHRFAIAGFRLKNPCSCSL